MMQQKEVEWAIAHGVEHSGRLVASVDSDGLSDGWELWVALAGQGEAPLVNARGQRRMFASADTAKDLLVRLRWRGPVALDWVGRTS